AHCPEALGCSKPGGPAPCASLGCSESRGRRYDGVSPPGLELPMNATDLVDRARLRDDVPDFAPGDTLKVHVRVVEGNRERFQVFQGIVIRRKGSGSRETFT